MSFKQILREKMGENASHPSQSQSSESISDAPHMAYLLGQIPRFQTQKPRGHYPSPKIRPQRKPHVLSESQQISFAFIKKFAADLSDGFSATEIKKAFRMAAMTLHPDRGGDAKQFIELKSHYENLRFIVT
ncbi:MAG: J domain-containing protein [Bdellovibrio sp.]